MAIPWCACRGLAAHSNRGRIQPKYYHFELSQWRPTEKQAQEASSCEYVTEEVSQWRPLRSIAADILIGLAGPTEKQAQEGTWPFRGGLRRFGRAVKQT